MEENAELIAAIVESTWSDSKSIGVLEELADVYLGCLMISCIFGRTTEVNALKPDTQKRFSGSISMDYNKNTYILLLSMFSQHIAKILRKPEPSKEDVDILIDDINMLISKMIDMAKVAGYSKDILIRTCNIKLRRLEKNIQKPNYY